MRVRAALAVLGGLLALGGALLFAVPSPFDDVRSPAVAGGLALLALAAGCGDSRLSPRNLAGTLLLASLLTSVLVTAGEGVAFLRQVRTQAAMSPTQRRDAFLEYSVGMRGSDLAEIQRTIPEDASVLILWNSRRNGYVAQLLTYYLRPRRVYFWRGGPAFHLLDGRAVGLPDEAWLRSRGIRWAVLLQGRLGSRARAVPLDEVPRL